MLNLVPPLHNLPFFQRSLIPHHGLSGAIRTTVYIIFVALLIATGLLVIPAKTDRDILPLPQLQLLKYSTDMCYVFAGIR